MSRPRALILTTAGTNCDAELGVAFELAGAEPRWMHLNELLAEPEAIDRFDLIGLPGGFSYGDAVAAGRIAAHRMRQALYPAFVRAIERGVPVIAPCNGFQIAVQMGLLPGPAPNAAWPAQAPAPAAALAVNESARFIDRWCRIEVPRNTRCIWTAGLECDPETALLPIAHGEGRFIPGPADLIEQLEQSGQVALRYQPGDNPNGSVAGIAGICDASGLVLGLMPHPERFTRWVHHPWWTRLGLSSMTGDPLGLRMFRSAVAHVNRALVV